MKYPGCILEFTRPRNLDLTRAYRYVMSLSSVLGHKSIGEMIVELPSARFWISEERATVVVSQLARGKNPLAKMRPTKREMFMEIFSRYRRLAPAMPDLRLSEIVALIINSPAPKFYMAPRTASEIIYRIKSGFYEQYCDQAYNRRKRPKK